MNLRFKPTAVKDLKRLPIMVRKRVLSRLDYYAQQPDPLKYAAKLAGFSKGGDYRFRVGRYRIVFDQKNDVIYILHVEHRRDVYRRK